MAERLNALVLKTSMGASPSWVRIPLPPPLFLRIKILGLARIQMSNKIVSMKNSLAFVLIALLMIPAFVPWMPHGTIHALHDHQAEHHGVESHGHSHDKHDHNCPDEQTAHHSINFDVSTYFSDYLHVDLQSPEQAVLKAPVPEAHDIDYTLGAFIEPAPRYELASVQSRAPPDGRRLEPDKTPLYLSTQRLRI